MEAAAAAVEDCRRARMGKDKKRGSWFSFFFLFGAPGAVCGGYGRQVSTSTDHKTVDNGCQSKGGTRKNLVETMTDRSAGLKKKPPGPRFFSELAEFGKVAVRSFSPVKLALDGRPFSSFGSLSAAIIHCSQTKIKTKLFCVIGR